MPEPLADDDDVDASGEHERGLSVPEVMQADAAQADLLGELGEPVGESIGVQGDAVGAWEDQVVVVVGVFEQCPAGVLPEAVGQQDADRVGVEVDHAVLAAGGLGPAERDPPVVDPAEIAGSGEVRGEGDDLLADVQAALVEVDVGPAQPDGLSAA